MQKYSNAVNSPRWNPTTMIPTMSNALTCAFLYRASVVNPRVPKDYMLVYLFLTYVEKNPPSSDLQISQFSKYTKLSYYNSPFLTNLYSKKEFLIFPALFGQTLSNYLTPTRLGLNRKYQSGLITRIMDPIWINFSLGVRSHAFNWTGLAQSYLIHNGIVTVIFLLLSFKVKFLDLYYKIKYGMSEELVATIAKSYMLNAFHLANSWTNFMYLPNLLSMLLIALSAPLMKPTRLKFQFKAYMKSIGFVSAFLTLVANSMDFIPDWGLRGPSNVRRLSKKSIDGVNDYVFQILVLSKYRILKENHAYLRGLNWPRLEALAMCAGVYKLMSLNDSTTDEDVKNDPLVLAVGRIM